MSDTLFIRTKKVEHFTRISNSVLQNGNLSMQAIGLFCYILSLPDDWKIRLTEVQKHFKNGRESFRSAIKELEENGYLIREEVERTKGKFGGYNFQVIEEPDRGLKAVDGEPSAETNQLQTTNKNKLLNNKISEDKENTPSSENSGKEAKKSFKNKDYEECISLINSCRQTLLNKGKKIDTADYRTPYYKKILHQWFSEYGVEKTKQGILNSINHTWLIEKGYKIPTLFSDTIFPQCVSKSEDTSSIEIKKGQTAFVDKERSYENDEGGF